MKVLLPITFSVLPTDVLKPLLLLSVIFKNLCANGLGEDHLMKVYHDITIILIEESISSWILKCHEACYSSFSTRSVLRWSSPLQMDVPIWKVFNWLKKKKEAKNKSLLESSMVMCYLRYEIQTFGSHYFELTIPSMIAMHPRNEVQCDYRPAMILTVFHMKGSLFGCAHKWHLTHEEYNVAHLHTLLNRSEAQLHLQ